MPCSLQGSLACMKPLFSRRPCFRFGTSAGLASRIGLSAFGLRLGLDNLQACLRRGLSHSLGFGLALSCCPRLSKALAEIDASCRAVSKAAWTC